MVTICGPDLPSGIMNCKLRMPSSSVRSDWPAKSQPAGIDDGTEKIRTTLWDAARAGLILAI